jgi:tetratricopeptide (TPR) repeat protein
MNRVFLFLMIPLFLLSTVDIKTGDNPRGGGKKGLKGYEKQWKELFEDSMEYYTYLEFNNALKGFRRLLVRDRNNCNINFYTGMCLYYMSTPSYQIIPYMEKAVQKVNQNFSYSYKETAAPTVAWLSLGEVYLMNYKFTEAIEAFQTFKTFLTDRNRDAEYLSQVDNMLRYCINAKKYYNEPLENVEVSSFSIINTDYSEYSPFISSDGEKLYFASDRKGSSGGPYLPGRFKTDIYYLVKNKEGRWTRPRKMGNGVCTSSF